MTPASPFCALLWISDPGTQMIAVLLLLMVAMILVVGGILFWQSSPAVRRRRIALVLIVVAAAAAGYVYHQRTRNPCAMTAGDVIELTSVEMWPDAISMFEDKLRIRFRYRNKTDRPVDAFSVHFRLHDASGDTLIDDYISISNRLGPKKASAWTQDYWATCPQGFSLEEWDVLTHGDIADFEVQWEPEGLYFGNGEVIH